MPRLLPLSILLLATVGSGCAFVELNEQGQRVRVVDSAALTAGCVRKGEITSRVTRDVGPFERNSQKVADEVEALARNDAATLSANTIVAVSPLDGNGERRYVAYDCRDR